MKLMIGGRLLKSKFDSPITAHYTSQNLT